MWRNTSRKFYYPVFFFLQLRYAALCPFLYPLFAEVRKTFHNDHGVNASARLTRRVIDPETIEVPEAFQPGYRQPLSLAFRSRVESAVPSASDWSDIDSALFQ